MSEWSQLPRELLDLIARHLSSDTDFLRFRSVCSSWRFSVPDKPHNSYPSRFPVIPNDGISDTSWGFKLSRRTIYLLRSSPSNAWILKLDSEIPHRFRLFHPLSRSHLKPLPLTFPKLLDISRYRIHELGQEYTLQYINYRPLASSIGEAGNLYMEKVALCLEKHPPLGFVLLTIHVSGKLVIYRSGASKWTVINDLSSPYDDVIAKDGRFYAVDSTGRAVTLNLDSAAGLDLTVVAHPVFGGDKKFLVESCGDLLMVDKYLTVGPGDDLGYSEGFEFYEEFDCFMSERTLKFKVYKLDEEGQKWVEVASLKDRILFLGENCTFSALVSELNPECTGNRIVFADYYREGDGVWKIPGIGVSNLESGSIGPINSFIGYSELFWPPPSWISSASQIELPEIFIHSENMTLSMLRVSSPIAQLESGRRLIGACREKSVKMPKKMGVNSKSEAARARKSAADCDRKEREAREKEDQYWREAEGAKSRASKKREEEAEKRAEAAAKKAEARRLAEQEEKELEKSLKKPDKKANRVAVPVPKMTEAELRRRREEEQAAIQKRAEEEKKRQSRIAEEEEYERVVLVTNTNRDDSIIEARTVDEALAHMTIADNLPVDKHPEKRLKASFKAFEEAELRRLKEEKPGLTHTQYKDLIWKLWKKSPDNPLNQYLGMDMYANSLLKYLLLFASMSFFLCPSFPD
nr:F-box protein SKIP23-like [Ipomoea batatas]